MPLLKRQPFQKEEIPPGLNPDDEVFFCEVTGEIFTEYEKFFERIILCNSLVWACSVTGRSGLTYQEAVESEERAQKQISDFPNELLKPVLYLSTLTHRSRILDVNDDVFGFVRDRYFIDEHVVVLHDEIKKTCKIIRVISPSEPKAVSENGTNDADSDCMIVEDSDDEPLSKITGSAKKKSVPGADSQKYQYVVQELNTPSIYIVDAAQVSRPKGHFGREKCRIFLKNHCAADTKGIFKVKDRYVKKYGLKEINWSDFYDGQIPIFGVTKTRKEATGSQPEVTEQSIDLTEDEAIKNAKKEARDKRKKDVKKHSREQLIEERKRRRAQKAREKRAEMKKQKSPAIQETIEEKMSRMSRDELIAFKQSLKEKRKKELEEERQKKREEKQQEKLKKLEEQKRMYDIMKEWSKPRDDLECDDLKDLPRPHPVHSRVPDHVFGSAILVLEFLTNCMTDLFNVNQQFPKGITLDDLGKAIQENDTSGQYGDLVSFLLTSIFQLQDEEEACGGAEDIDTKGSVPADFGASSGLTYQKLVRQATVAAQLPQLSFGTGISHLHLDCFTLTEVLRLHLLASGSEGSEVNLRFRYQQRGGYSPLDDPGLDFRRKEGAIMKALTEANLFDLSPEDKLKVLEVLVHQLMTFMACRESIEESFEKLKQARNELKLHIQTELRREREEQLFWAKKRVEEKNREREQKKKELEERLKSDETGQAPADQSNPMISQESSQASDKQAEVKTARQSTRQKVLRGQDPSEPPPPPEEMDWENVTEEQRQQIKEWADKREKELQQSIARLQHCTAIYPLGRDRTYRRYWTFQAISGVFVEDSDDFVPNEILIPVAQKLVSKNAPEPSDSNSNCVIVPDDKSASDKENQCNGEVPHSNGDVNSELEAHPDDLPVAEEQAKNPFISVCEQIEQQGKVRWSYYRTGEELEELIARLNPRGFREGPLRLALIEQKQALLDTIKKCPVKQLFVSGRDSKGECVRFMELKSRNKQVQGLVSNAQASEYMELNLRESLLDLEERIYAGGLGSLKVSDRLAWRQAIEQGLYSPQAATVDVGTTEVDIEQVRQAAKPADEETGSYAMCVVKDLALALLQISRMPEPKYLKPPLGEDEEARREKQGKALELAFKGLTPSKIKAKVWDRKDKKKTGEDDDDQREDDEITSTPSETHVRSALERWQESLLNSTSLSQIFIYLSVLDKSIIWDFSALVAKCKLCRRKGDDEKMLLCDGCDRGFHMYCLKPPLKKVPQGDWFCPTCRPKDVTRTPHVKYNKKKIVVEESSDESSSEESEDEEESEEEEVEEEEVEEEEVEEEEVEDPDATLDLEDTLESLGTDVVDTTEDDEDETDSDEETEEEEQEPAKIRFGGFKGRKAPTPVAVSPTDSSKSSRSNTPVQAVGKKRGSRPNTPGSAGRGRTSLEKAIQLKAVGKKMTEITKDKRGRHSIETEQPSTSKAKRAKVQESPGPGRPRKAGRSLETGDGDPSTSKGRPGRKRKSVAAFSEEEYDMEGLPCRKALTKSRNNETVQLLKDCEQLAGELLKKDEAWPFLKPVSKREAPDYFNIIKHPMDLGTVKANLNKASYTEPGDVLHDLNLVFTNCFSYNMPTAPEFIAGQKLQRYFNKRVKELQLDKIWSGVNGKNQAAGSKGGKKGS